MKQKSFLLYIFFLLFCFVLITPTQAQEMDPSTFRFDQKPNLKTKEECEQLRQRVRTACIETPDANPSQCSTKAESEYYRCMELVPKEEAPAGDEKENGFQIPSADSLNQFHGLSAKQVIGNFLKTAMGIMGSIAFAIMVAGGFLWMTAGGNSDKERKAIDMIVWASLGVAVILSSYTIVRFVFDAFTN